MKCCVFFHDKCPPSQCKYTQSKGFIKPPTLFIKLKFSNQLKKDPEILNLTPPYM